MLNKLNSNQSYFSITRKPTMNPTQSILNTLIHNLSLIKTKSQAKQLHAQLLKTTTKSISSPSITSLVLSIYCNLNLLPESLSIFNTLHLPPPSLAWKSIIKCYASNGLFLQSLSSFIQMRALGKIPDCKVFPSVLKACTHLMDLRLGESVHGCIIRLGVDFDIYTGNALMNMYSKLQAFKVFDGTPQSKYIGEFRSSSFSCNDLYDKCGKPVVGTDRKVRLNQIDNRLPRNDGEGEAFKHTRESRMDGTLKLDCVRKVFEMMPYRDIVSWNTVIGGHVEHGLYDEALMMVREMGKTNLKPDSFTLSTVLPIFAKFVDILKGKEIHGYAIRRGFVEDLFIGSSLIDMYANCNRVEDSYRLFALLPQPDSVSWNSIIAGCVQNGLFDEGLKLFRQMLLSKIKPMHASFSSIMPACAHLTALYLGKQLHGYIIRGGFDDNVLIASSLVDMYAKCGDIRLARWIFDKMEVHDAVSWTAMIMGCASHGDAHDAISLFEQMALEGAKPNYVSFVAVLTACSHAGLVDEARNYFKIMTQDYGIAPGLEHYAAVADVLGRAGKLEEAYDLLSSLPIRSTGSVWSALLAACRVHKNVELAEKVAKELFAVDPENMGAYVLLSNTYSAAGKWKHAAKLRISMKDRGVEKKPGCSWIEFRNKVHAFVSGDKSHPHYEKINVVQRVLFEQMEKEIYIPSTSEELYDAEEVQL